MSISPAAAPLLAQLATTPFGFVETAGPNGEHHIEPDRQMITLREMVSQFAKETFGVRVANGKGIDGAPQLAHRQIPAAFSAKARLDELGRQFPTEPDVIGPEQAVMGQAEGLRQDNGVRVGARPYLIKHGHDRLMLTMAVIGLRCQSAADPKRERSIGLKQRKDVLQPGF